VTKAVYKDSVEIFGLREPAILEKLFAYLSSVTGGLVNLVKLSSMLGVDRIQAGKYLHFLQNTLLIFPLHKYSRKVRETVRSQEKMHLIDQGFCEVYQTEKGAKLESVVARHVWERYPKDTYFWRDKTEVDIVIDLKKSLLPLEVKNSSSLGKQDLSGLVSFCKKFRQKHALVIYNGRKQSQKLAGIRIEFYPVWDFLLEES
jgi:predicted AAA+ superfamily ATPase